MNGRHVLDDDVPSKNDAQRCGASCDTVSNKDEYQDPWRARDGCLLVNDSGGVNSKLEDS
jgi:hypothetical protein